MGDIESACIGVLDRTSMQGNVKAREFFECMTPHFIYWGLVLVSEKDSAAKYDEIVSASMRLAQARQKLLGQEALQTESRHDLSLAQVFSLARCFVPHMVSALPLSLASALPLSLASALPSASASVSASAESDTELASAESATELASAESAKELASAETPSSCKRKRLVDATEKEKAPDAPPLDENDATIEMLEKSKIVDNIVFDSHMNLPATPRASAVPSAVQKYQKEGLLVHLYMGAVFGSSERIWHEKAVKLGALPSQIQNNVVPNEFHVMDGEIRGSIFRIADVLDACGLRMHLVAESFPRFKLIQVPTQSEWDALEAAALHKRDLARKMFVV